MWIASNSGTALISALCRFLLSGWCDGDLQVQTVRRDLGADRPGAALALSSGMSRTSVAGLSYKQQAFVEHYLHEWNGKEAALLAGYSPHTARQQASRLLSNVNIQAAIQARIEDLKVSADEVLLRLAEHARGDMRDFIDPKTLTIDFQTAADKGKMRLVKKVKVVTRKEPSRDGDTIDTIETIEFELYDAQAALALLGKHHKLFTDKVETTKAEDPVEEQFREDILSRLSRLAPRGDAAAVPGGSDSTAT